MTTQDLQLMLNEIRTKKEKVKFLASHVGTLSAPSKMPCHSYSIPAIHCKTGKRLHDIAKEKGIKTVCGDCYALKGFYQMPDSKNAMAVRYNAVVNNPYWAVYMLELIRLHTIAQRKPNPFFRWHDSGDLQSEKHFLDIIWIAEQLPDVQFWIPTRENSIVKKLWHLIPSNLCVRVSNHLVDSDKSAKSFETRSCVLSAQNGSDICPATLPGSNKKCNDCRKCWNKDIAVINYLIH